MQFRLAYLLYCCSFLLGHQSMATTVKLNEGIPAVLALDPVRQIEKLSPGYIMPLRRADSTVFVGYIVSSDTGEPVEGAKISCFPTGVATWSDAEGFFQLSVPWRIDTEFRDAPAKLFFQKAGFITEEHHNVELWPNGDWVFQVQMVPGEGSNIVDQGGKRISIATLHPGDVSITFYPEEVVNILTPANATLRIPTHIRVLMTNGIVEHVSMETYVARSVSHEWYSSWGNYPGGMNSLKAGAVAVRSYAAWHVNNASTNSTYDICATASCQVYRKTSSANGNIAANQTAGYVVVGSNNAIARSEYSAENNSRGFSCGDGYTQPRGCHADPVCRGETRFGHGRGMCQWGTFKWATGLKVPGNGSNYPINANSGVLNGFPRQDWNWLLSHYYPNFKLVHGRQLLVGDTIRTTGTNSYLLGRMSPGGGIGNGMSSPVVTTNVRGSFGTIVSGPVRVTSDRKGFTWWKIAWHSGQQSWLPENWIELVPAAPTQLRLLAYSSNEVQLAWNSDASLKLGYRIERSDDTSTNWVQIAELPDGVTSYADATVASTNGYRVRAYNLGGNSPYSNVISLSGPELPMTTDESGEHLPDSSEGDSAVRRLRGPSGYELGD